MPVSLADRALTSQPTQAVRSNLSVAAPSHVEHSTMHTVVPWSREMRSNNSNNRKVVALPDVSEQVREDHAVAVRNKFQDVFEVGKHDCVVLDESALGKVEEVSVAGRLSLPESVKFFESLGAPKSIVSTLRDGHFSKFNSYVPPIERKNNGSFYKHEAWAVQEVKNLIKDKKVEIVKARPYCVNPLHVVIQPKKNRLILDCSILNEYITAPKFKLDDYKVALNFFKERGWIFVYDFKDGYYHVKMHEDFKQYLGFKLVLDGQLTYCQFKVGFLGLSDLPWLFTKIFRVLIKHWRSLHMECCIYLDDGWNFHRDLDQARLASRHVRSDLLKAGVVWSIKKCFWEPQREVEWLGMVWNAEHLTLKILERRVNKLKGCIDSLLQANSVSIRKLSSFAGQVVSLGPVMGGVTRLRSRFTQITIASAPSYDTIVGISLQVTKELVFWKDNVDSLNCRSCAKEQSPVVVVVKGDASATGCGSFIVNSLVKTARLFSQEEQDLHSTWRELENVRFSLTAMVEQLQGRTVTFLVDNSSAVQIIQNGSMKEVCHKLALDINEFCSDNSIVLNAQWIPRGENKDADELSRLADLLDTDDWGLSSSFFKLLNNKFGPFSVDCFANYYNFKVDKFFSLFLTPGTAGVNAFAFDWHSENCLLVPPVAIIGRVLYHLLACKARGTLVVPLWKSAFYWPLLCVTFRPFIRNLLVVKAANVLVQGRNKNSLLGSESFSSMMLALFLDCSDAGF